MGTYVPNTEIEQKKLLVQTGLSSLEDLFSMIPEEVRLSKKLDIPQGMSEMEVMRCMEDIGSRNRIFGSPQGHAYFYTGGRMSEQAFGFYERRAQGGAADTR